MPFCVMAAGAGSPILLLDSEGHPSYDELFGFVLEGALCNKPGADVFLDLSVHREWIERVCSPRPDNITDLGKVVYLTIASRAL